MVQPALYSSPSVSEGEGILLCPRGMCEQQQSLGLASMSSWAGADEAARSISPCLACTSRGKAQASPGNIVGHIELEATCQILYLWPF